ncbi:hypothetical protein, partial [Peribacillus alkalitolerans]|uniref:hypothetical protein n=1 Tax=Peribacillus alkalitolerans TaxID=1550385 RepID=UPI001967958D
LWTPLLLANGSHIPTPIADFHRLVDEHAWHTKKQEIFSDSPALCVYPLIYFQEGSLCICTLIDLPN